MLMPTLAMYFHSTWTYGDTLVGNLTLDLRLVILTLYQLEQLSYVILPNFVYMYPFMHAYTAYSAYSAYSAYNQ